MNVERTAQWKAFAASWGKHHPPARPSAGDIRIIEQFLVERKPKNALVLGCTVEFRDLLSRHRVPTTVFDINPEMVGALTSMMQESAEREEYVIGNWMEENPGGPFDLILSDYAVNQLPKEKWPALLKRIRDWLAGDGVFVNRSYWDIHNQAPPAEEWVARWSAQPLTPKNVHDLWWGELFYYCYDERSSEIRNQDRKALWEEVLAGKSENSPERKLFDASVALCEMFDKEWTVLGSEEQERILSAHFRIISEEHAPDYEWAFHCPIFLLGK